MSKIAFQAYASNKYRHVTADTPRAAAEKFFSENPRAKKCEIVEGTHDGAFFTQAFRLNGEGRPARSFRDVTKAKIAELPAA